MFLFIINVEKKSYIVFLNIRIKIKTYEIQQFMQFLRNNRTGFFPYTHIGSCHIVEKQQQHKKSLSTFSFPRFWYAFLSSVLIQVVFCGQNNAH